MSLVSLQHDFLQCVADLIKWIDLQNGYQVTGGELYRPPEVASLYSSKGMGIKNSVHTKRLAIDLMIFKDGVYLTKTEDYKFAGEYWKRLNQLARWGGDFKSIKDGNHFSFEYEGVK